MGTKINLYQHQSVIFDHSLDDIMLKLLKKRRKNNFKSLLFCGCEPAVGTTSITINLAVALAQGKNKTLLIDGDMRKLAKHKRLGESPSYGLSDFLSDKAKMSEIINETNIENLDYITCGSWSQGQSSVLLGSPSLESFVSSLYDKYDFILFDSPSLDVVNDAAVLSMLVDGVFIIVELGRTTRANISKTLYNLSVSYDKILGVLVNKVNQPEYRVYMKNYDYFQTKRYIH